MPTYNFPPTSRYLRHPTATMKTVNGRRRFISRRRFLAVSAENFVLLVEHRGDEDERLDNIAARYMDDPECFGTSPTLTAAMRPEELTETVGRSVRITLAGRNSRSSRMLKGVHLTLMIGPAVPVPAPQSVMDALTSIQVTS